MERKKINKTPSAILTSDWHLREDIPVCRTDDFWVSQWGKVDFISDLQMKYDCPVIHAGDLFDRWKPSPELLTRSILHLPKKFITIYGQHDLPQHSLELAYKCGIDTLVASGSISFLNKGVSWGELPENKEIWHLKDRSILVWHKMNYQGEPPWPGCTDPKAGKLLRKYPQYSLILTGDNHKPFVEEYEGRLLVNPGSLMRQDADQVDFRPRVYLWYADTNTVEPVYIPIEDGAVSRDHLIRKQERDDRLEAFVSKLNNDWEGTVSFEENLERLMKENEIGDKIKEIVYKAVEI
jgi:DNA repair exonuclease SbcCD nuclease subunit